MAAALSLFPSKGFRGPVRSPVQDPTRAPAKTGTQRFIAQKSLLPQLNGTGDFFSDDGGATFRYDTQAANSVSLAFAAYWYCATRWRAQKIAEAPLMVVEEDQEDGSEEWIPDHELADVLDDPSPDYDMGELLERTSRYLDDDGEALWVMDRDRAGRVARLTPFRRKQFEIVPVAGRLYGAFKVTTAAGSTTYPAEKVCYFRDTTDGWTQAGRSRLDIAMHWLRLGESARQTIKDLLENAVWPSAVAIPDKDWNPDDDELDEYKAEINAYAQPGKRGKAFAMVGGGRFEILSARIRDLVPVDVLNRVESVVSAISGVPAIVLQFQVGMENSPWSQMEQARRMAYDDTIQPAWRKIERVLTRQLLRPDYDDRSHFIRFDRSQIASLQIDRAQAATTASLMGRAASLNERRNVMGLEPSDDPKADDIPELTAPIVSPVGKEPDETKARTRGVAALSSAFRREASEQWKANVQHLLRTDATEIERIVRDTLVIPAASKAAPVHVQRVVDDVVAYLRSSKSRWGTVVIQLMTQGAERAAAVTAADLGIGFNSLHPHVVEFAKREAATLITGIADTTRTLVAKAIVQGLADGKSVEAIARDVAQCGAFTPARAQLIAQTESTKASEGGPTEALQAFSRETGRQFVKRWSGRLDLKERDEHVALEGETKYVDEPFSNGRQYPGEPNCRCSVTLSEVEDE